MWNRYSFVYVFLNNKIYNLYIIVNINKSDHTKEKINGIEK